MDNIEKLKELKEYIKDKDFTINANNVEQDDISIKLDYISIPRLLRVTDLYKYNINKTYTYTRYYRNNYIENFFTCGYENVLLNKVISDFAFDRFLLLWERKDIYRNLSFEFYLKKMCKYKAIIKQILTYVNEHNIPLKNILSYISNVVIKYNYIDKEMINLLLDNNIQQYLSNEHKNIFNNWHSVFNKYTLSKDDYFFILKNIYKETNFSGYDIYIDDLY